MFRDGYSEVKVQSGQAWVLSSKIRDLQKIDSIFFDCDGVLVDVRESYDATIIETVRLLAKGLMLPDIPDSVPIKRVILELKRSGGFNNDWNVSYALLLSIYVFLEEALDVTPLILSSVDRERILLRNIQSYSNCTSPNLTLPEFTWNSVSQLMISLARRADSTGIVSLERILLDEGHEEALRSVKKLLGYPVETSIVGRVFDEIFYGPDLFRKKFGIDPKFYNGIGLVEMEIPAVSQEALRRLIAHVGKERVGIVSGRDYISAEKTLGELIKSFDSDNLLFLMVDPDHSGKNVKSPEPLLNKPDPEILIRAVKRLDRFQCFLYVGDSAEDLIMVQRANKIARGFFFAGIYALANFKDEVCSYFLEKGADIVLPSVNDLPELLEIIGEWK